MPSVRTTAPVAGVPSGLRRQPRTKIVSATWSAFQNVKCVTVPS
jgi:hypothetical protein